MSSSTSSSVVEFHKDNSVDSEKRYTRSTLYHIRNESQSRKKPNRDLQMRLQLLGVWRIKNTNNNNLSSGGIENVENNTSTSSNYTDSSARPQRQTSMRNENSSTLTSPNYVAPYLGSPNNIMDHRSISSSHLMPAFAKRRIAATSQNSNPPSVSKGNSPEGRDASPLEMTRGRTRHKVDEDIKRSDGQETFQSHGRKLPEDIEPEVLEQKRNTDKSKSPARMQNSRPGVLNAERRIGSGRLVHPYVNWDSRSPEHDFFSNSKTTEKDIHTQNVQRNANRIPERFNDRRSFNRKNVEDRVHDKTNNKNSIQNNRSTSSIDNMDSFKTAHQNQTRHRRSYHYNDRNEEPEWFSGGPTSQHDTIELHGFDDLEEPYNRNKTSKPKSRANDRKDKGNSSNSTHGATSELQSDNLIGDEKNSSGNRLDSPESNISMMENKSTNELSESRKVDSFLEDNGRNESDENGKHITTTNDDTRHGDFNFDNFLNMESLNENLMRVDDEFRNGGTVIEGSRFSRWFGNNDNNEATQINNSNVETKKEDYNNVEGSNHSNMLMEFIQQTKLKSESVPSHVSIPSVEELEARMRKLDGNDSAHTSIQKECELPNFVENGGNVLYSDTESGKNMNPDTEAFKRLLEQLGSENKKQTNMLNIFVPQQENNDNFVMLRNGELPNSILPHPVPPMNYEDPVFHHGKNNLKMINDFVMPHVIAFFNGQQQKIMEAEHVLKGLILGEISVQFLEQKLRNPNTPPHMKEIICSVLPHFPLIASSLYSQPIHSPVPIAMLQHPPFSNPHIVPSLIPEDHIYRMQVNSRDMQSHNKNGGNQHDGGTKVPQERDAEVVLPPSTQGESQQNVPILTEMIPQVPHQRILPPHMPVAQPSLPHQPPTPLAFTPTSVLRKMTADKEIPHTENRGIISRPFMEQNPQPTEQNFPHPLPAILPRMILGGHNTNQQQQFSNGATQLSPQSIESQHQASQMRNSQPIKWQKPLEGRPILKGPLPMQLHPQQPTPQNILYANKVEHQLTQRVKSNPQIVNSGSPVFPMTQHQIFPHPHRIFALPRQLQIQPMLQPPHAHQQMDMPNRIVGLSPNNEIMNADAELKSNVMNYQRDGKLSPTSNQLAQWFSPELLAQASAGKLPLLNVNQALSLEEFERSIQHSSATVHN